MGLSPRVRGNQNVSCEAVAADGSIPAGAGEPTGPTNSTPLSRVYPRGCGGTYAQPYLG